MAFSLPKPVAPVAPDLQSGLLSQIQRLLNPTQGSLAEADTNAAGAALASGVPGGSAFGQNQKLVLRDSEQRQRLDEAAKLYEPYAQRASTEKLATQSEAAADARLAEQGRQAMAQLQLQESGQNARATGAQLAALKQQALEGQQAMERLNAQTQAQAGLQTADLASRENIARIGIDADTARQAMSEAGLNARLTSSQAADLQQSIVRGDQARQLQLLQDAGADARQVQALQNALEQTRLQGQNQANAQRIQGQNAITETLLQAYLAPTRTSSGVAAPVNRSGVTSSSVIPVTASGQPVYQPQNPLPNVGGGGVKPINSSAIDRILAQYGINNLPNLSQYYA